MKILIFGASGQVGSALLEVLSNYDVIPINKAECDITNPNHIKNIIDQNKSNLIINAAAYTKVDQAEDEKDIVFEINSNAPKVMAEKAFEYKVPFIHFSTDYVFDGKKKNAYVENDITNPLSIYGKSKLEGERQIQDIGGQFYIFRISWIYSKIRKNFYLSILEQLKENRELRVVHDQFGVPTSNYFIAREIKKIINKFNINNKGIYNLTPNGRSSWFDFAKLIISKTNPEFNYENLKKISTQEFKPLAPRPKNSVLNNNKIQSTFMIEFDDWEHELDQFINES